MPDSPVAVYVHTPFCLSKCGYCDFNSYAMHGEIVQRTVDAILLEIARSPWRGRPAKTVYFGGGTPTFLAETQLLSIFDAVAKAHPPAENAEITCEANPGTADSTKFQAMQKAGFNRISLGAQSFLDSDLKRLGRAHTAADISAAVEVARAAGFDNLSLDLMFALPGQTMAAWNKNLRRVLELQTDHLSLYCLTIEPGTAYHRLHLTGNLTQPDDEAQIEMYDACVDTLAEAGFEQYEISNFAKADRKSAHNLCYWRGEEYLAYGPGAVGAAARKPLPLDGGGGVGVTARPSHPRPKDHTRLRYTNLRKPAAYCEALESAENHWEETEDLDEQTLRTERIMLGLRLAEGIPADGLEAKVLEKQQQRGWIEQRAGRIRLTPLGRHFHTDVAANLI